MTRLIDIFEIAADAYEQGLGIEGVNRVLEEAGAAAGWYWVIGPARGRPRPAIQISTWSKHQAFASITFPIVRRVFHSLVANELVVAQPMSAPSGALFYMEYLYDGSKKPDDAG